MERRPLDMLAEIESLLDWAGVTDLERIATKERSASGVGEGELMPRKKRDDGEELVVAGRDRLSASSWTQIAAEAAECTLCRLCETRNNVVFGVGCTKQPPIVFVGEGPGADEDRLGEPFVGRAGKLLTAAITQGMGLRREDVYICNVVKCRPPQNRTPLPDEVEACSPYLYRQLELLQPKVIITLGAPAQLALTGVKGGITKIRGSWLEWRGMKVMPTLHPAYLLRNPPAKKFFWEDLKEVMRELGLEAPPMKQVAP